VKAQQKKNRTYILWSLVPVIFFGSYQMYCATAVFKGGNSENGEKIWYTSGVGIHATRNSRGQNTLVCTAYKQLAGVAFWQSCKRKIICIPPGGSYGASLDPLAGFVERGCRGPWRNSEERDGKRKSVWLKCGRWTAETHVYCSVGHIFHTTVW